MSDTFEKYELADIDAQWEVSGEHNLIDFSVQEISMVESLLSPGLQTAIKVHSYKHIVPPKNFDAFKNIKVNIKISRQILEDYGFAEKSIQFSPTIYRLANRKNFGSSHNDEEMIFYACHRSLLTNVQQLVSESFNGRTPDQVTEEIFSRMGIENTYIEPSYPMRDYMAENIRPFEVLKQQADAALSYSGNDPSFVHFMTYENGGTHYFRSLQEMSNENKNPVLRTKFGEAIFRPTGAGEATRTKSDHFSGYKNPLSIMQYSFPCDFDLVTDLLNGVDLQGAIASAVAVIDPFSREFFLKAVPFIGTVDAGQTFKFMMNNFNTANERESQRFGTENSILKRQARMNLLDPDKIALRMTVPWNPMLHAGKLIKVEFPNANRDDNNTLVNYGSGTYLISALVHTIKHGGYSTTTLDCVSSTVGAGIV